MGDRCRSCNAPIIWAVTENGRRMPVDAHLVDPIEDGGNIALVDGVAYVIPREGRAAYADQGLYTSHFATCPNAARHRRRPTTETA